MRPFQAALAASLLLLLGAPAHADRDGDKKKAEREWREAEKGQKAKPGAQPVAGEAENPLLKILKLMEEVENRLYDADTGDFTQQEQRKIVEAMKFEDKTSAALQELIEKIEKQGGS